jgi:CHAT domain-containing protein/Tfp pilus assembly protein PilF
MIALSLLLCATISAGAPADTIRPGDTVRSSLAATDPVLAGHGPSRSFVLDAKEAGPLTVALESHDFDAFLRLETAAGKLIAEADGGGIETNASVVIQARAGARYRVIAAAAAMEGAGEMALSVTKGEVPLPKGKALAEAAAAFRARAAERAIQRGDKKAAAEHRLEEGESLLDTDVRRALAAFDASLALAREAGDRRGEANALASQANCHLALGALPRASELFERALDVARQARDRFTEAKVLVNLGRLHGRSADLPRARECYEAALAAARELKHERLEALVGLSLGELYLALALNAQGRDLLEKALALARQHGERDLEGSTLGVLGTYHSQLGDQEGAIGCYEGSLAISRELGDRSAEATTLGNLATAHYHRGDIAEAGKLYEESLTIAREVGDRLVEVNAIGNLGNVYTSLGDHRKAIAQYEKCIQLHRELGDRDGVAVFTANLGLAHLNVGEHARARERLEEALGLVLEIGNRRQQTMIQSNLGLVRSRLGDLQGARVCFERALALAREIGHRQAEATALGNLAVIHDKLGDLAKGRELQEQRLAICREIGDRQGEATALGNLGAVLNDLGDAEAAIEHHERSLALAREIRWAPEEARALGNLAVCRRKRGELAEARGLAEPAHALFVELGMEDEALGPLETLAGIAVEERDIPRAARALREAADFLDRSAAGGLETADAAGLRSRHADWEAIAHALTALRLGEAGKDAAKRAAVLGEGFREASRWKGRALLEGISEHRQGGRTAEVVRLRRDRKDTLARRERTLERASEAVRAGKPAEAVDALRAEAAALLEEAGDLAARIRKASPGDAELDAPAGATPEAVRKAAVQSDTLLIEYAPGKKRLFAYVLTAKSLHFLDLGEWTELRKHAGLVEALGNSRSRGSVTAIASSGKALHDALLAPALRVGGEEIRKLVIVPTPALDQLPFEALVVATKSAAPQSFADLELVIDRYEVSYAPSSAVLVELARAGARPEGGRALVLADPLYPSEAKPSSLLTAASLRGVPAPRTFQRLQKTRSEALAIARLLAEAGGEEAAAREELAKLAKGRSGSFSASRVDLHLGAEASPARLAGDLKGYEIIHLAAHGYVDREVPARTGIALAFGEGAGGYFTLADVLDLDLDARLVVLSACETAAGQVQRGEGMESMARAFLHAGARGVVASFWQVSDRAAAETMTRFYQALQAGSPPSRALREAKLALRRSASPGGTGKAKPAKGSRPADMSHPFYWAPFIHVGLPRQEPRR